MKKAALMILVATAAVSSLGQSIYVSKSQDRTAEDLPLMYKDEKTLLDRNGVRMIGTVKNTGQVTYKFVKVTFTASKSSGGFLARDYTYAEPSEIGPGQVGYIEMYVDTGGEKPGKVEWVITGRSNN